MAADGPGSEIDTGCNFDGYLKPELFRQWTNQMKPSVSGDAHFPNGLLVGDQYTDLYLTESRFGWNGIGLHFLARHIVTLDFPRRTMYLKRTSVGPLVDQDSVAAVNFLTTVKLNDQLPGWSKGDKGQIYVATPIFSGTVDAIKNGDQHPYHYNVKRPSQDANWTLERAWRTDARGQIEEYPIHKN